MVISTDGSRSQRRCVADVDKIESLTPIEEQPRVKPGRSCRGRLQTGLPMQVRGVNVQGFLFRTDLRAVVRQVSRLYFDEMSQLLVAAIAVFFSLLVLYAVRLCDPSFRVGWWLGLILVAPL